MRRLLVVTDGYALSVQECELSGLEVKATLEVLTSLLNEGQFPYPGEPPILEVAKPQESKKEN